MKKKNKKIVDLVETLKIKNKNSNIVNNNKTISLKEISTLLNYNEEYLRKVCNKLGFTQNGKITLLNENQFNLLKKSLLPRTSDMNVRAQNVKTKSEILENYKKATQDYILLINQELENEKQKNQQLTTENKLLQDNNKRLEIKQEAQTLQNKNKVRLKQKWSIIDKYIKQVATYRAEKFKGYVKDSDYFNTFKYFYNEFAKIHTHIDKKELKKAFFMKYPKYMVELLEIVIADDGLITLTEEENNLFKD